MNARNERMDWNRPSQAFRHLDGRMPIVEPSRRLPRASIEAWRTSPAVQREYNRGFRNGFIFAMALYGVMSAVLVLAFQVLGVRP